MALVPLGPPVLWRDLRRFTPARLALGRAGNGLPTQAHLAFQAAHAAWRRGKTLASVCSTATLGW